MCMQTAAPTWCTAYNTPAHFTKCSQTVTKHKCTYTLVLTYTCVHHSHNYGYVAPLQGVSQQEATRLVVPLAAGTPALSPHLHGPLSAAGYSSIGLQDP